MRPDSVNFPLFIHVLGAMVLTGTVLAVALSTAWAARGGGDSAGLARFGLKTVLLGVLPAWIVMRVGAQWTESEENLPEEIQDQAWLGIGYIAGDLGGVLIIVSAILAAIGLRRMRDGGAGAGQARVISIISLILIVVFVVAVWAMSAKPA